MRFRMNEFLEVLAVLGVLLSFTVIFGVTGIIVNKLYRDKYMNRKRYLESCISSYPSDYDFLLNELVCEYMLLCLKMGYKDREIYDMILKLRDVKFG